MPIATAPPCPDENVQQCVAISATPSADSPPTYEDSANPNCMPPTYESLYGEFQQVEDPKGLAQFVVKAFVVIISTMTAAVLLALLNIIPLAMIILGSSNLHNCAVEPYIPIWLIVTGLFSLVKSAINFYYRLKRRHEGRPLSTADVNPNPFDGSVWIYSVYDEVQYTFPEDSDYCNRFIYIFSFVFVTLGYTLLIFAMCCFCCCCCCICCRPKRMPRMNA